MIYVSFSAFFLCLCLCFSLTNISDSIYGFPVDFLSLFMYRIIKYRQGVAQDTSLSHAKLVNNMVSHIGLRTDETSLSVSAMQKQVSLVCKQMPCRCQKWSMSKNTEHASCRRLYLKKTILFSNNVQDGGNRRGEQSHSLLDQQL